MIGYEQIFWQLWHCIFIELTEHIKYVYSKQVSYSLQQISQLQFENQNALIMNYLDCDKILIMQINKSEEFEECFLDAQNQQPIEKQLQIKVQVVRTINERLPANQLRTPRRPDNMNPRSFLMDRPFHTLKNSINAQCQETLQQNKTNVICHGVTNRNNLTIQEYFSRKKFKCLYNKLQTCRSDCKTFIGKLKGIDSLIDYNWKSYKELQDEPISSAEIKQDIIDSDFQSGNCARVYCKTQSCEQAKYYLLIENDFNSYGYNNWFFFRFRNKDIGRRSFHLVNMIKKTPFFKDGMLISIFSIKQQRYRNVKWFKGGDNITFSFINLQREHHQNQYYNCLSFEFDFTNENDEVYFAFNQPYTYSRLVNFINGIDKQNKDISVEVKSLGYTISNNIIPTLTFSNRKCKPNSNVILLIARQHPCQTTGSFIMEGIMKQLIKFDPICQYLLGQFQFIVIPMINPDGVIHGMSRCNMAGLDLNRQWGETMLKELTPETVKVKNFMINLSKSRKIKYMIDLHGHGKKLNSFFFCCKGNDKQQQNTKTMLMIMQKMQQRFSLMQCTTGITKDKENTIRSKVNTMGVKHSYTLQTSLYGWKNKNGQIQHFHQYDYTHIARSLLQSIFLNDADTETTLKLLGFTKQQVVSEMADCMELAEKERKNNQNDQMSDSDPEGDILDVKDLLGKCQNKLIKRQLQQSYKSKQRQKNKKQYMNVMTSIQQNQFNKNSLRQSLCPSIRLNSQQTKYKHQKIKNVNRFNNTKIQIDLWKGRKNGSDRKKIVENRNQLAQGVNLMRTTLRKRIKTQASPQQKNNILMKTKNQKSFVKQYCTFQTNHKSFSKSLNYNSNSKKSSCQESKQQERKEYKDQFLKQIKQYRHANINKLLSNTLSILKIQPNQKQKRISEVKNYRQTSLQDKSNETSRFTSTEGAQYDDSAIMKHEASKYKIFKHFSNRGLNSNKFSKANSVFYHYPVL